MAVPGFNIGAVTHPHIVPIDAIVADFCDCAGQCRHNRCTLGSGNVNSRMEVPLTSHRMEPVPEPRCDFPAERRGKRIVDGDRRHGRIIRDRQRAEVRFPALLCHCHTTEEQPSDQNPWQQPPPEAGDLPPPLFVLPVPTHPVPSSLHSMQSGQVTMPSVGHAPGRSIQKIGLSISESQTVGS